MMPLDLMEIRTKKVEDAIEFFKNQNDTFKSLFNTLEKSKYDYGILGGFVRDSIEDKDKKNFRDIDIIVDAPSIEDILKKANIQDYSLNSFNGFKIKSSSIENPTFEIDIWSKSNHYAFAHNLCNKKWKNISKTTVINYDSLFYLRTMKNKFWTEGYDLFFEKKHRIDFFGFRKCIENKQSIAGILVKVGMILLNDDQAFLHHKLAKWIKPLITNKNLKDKMFQKYEEHYKKPLTEELYQKIVELIKAQNLNQF